MFWILKQSKGQSIQYVTQLRQSKAISKIHLDAIDGINRLGGTNRMPRGKIGFIY